jgi:hypothetical protein
LPLERDIQKGFAKILYDCLLPHANAAVRHYQAGFQSGKSTTANLQTTGTIYNKETQLLAYADDIDIVGRTPVSRSGCLLSKHWKEKQPKLCGSETWVLTKREENQFERKVLRTICGPKIENGLYRARYNHELKIEFYSPNALNVTKTSRLRHAGHMIRRPKTKMVTSDLNEKIHFGNSNFLFC